MVSPKELIQKYLKDNEITNAWLARRLGTKPQYLWKKFNRKDIEGLMITEISKACNHNFYQDLSRAYEAEVNNKHELKHILEEPEVKYEAGNALLRKIVREELKRMHENE